GPRPLRPAPEPAVQAPPVPGHPQAGTRRRAGPLPAEPRGVRHRPAGARRPLRGRQLGISDARGLGHRLAGALRRARDHAVHLLPAGRRAGPAADLGRADLRARAARDGAAGCRQRLRRAVGAGRGVPRGAAARRGRAVEVRLRAGGDGRRGVRRLPPRPVQPLLRLRQDAARFGARAARARALPEVFAPVQRARLERQYRRDRAHGLHPARPPAGRGDCPRLDGVDPDDDGGRRLDRELLLEIGVEEMPASWLPGLATQLAERLEARLTENGLPVRTSVESHTTPRRLCACVPALTDRQEDREERIMGPPVTAAFDAEGHPTPAGLGFARKLGIGFDDLETIDTPRGKYLSYLKRTRGRATVDVLPDVLWQVLRDLTFPKFMHWDAVLDDGRQSFTFGRPMRWLLYLYGGRVVPFTIARHALASSPRVQDVTSGAVTYGHRFLATSGRAGRAIKVRSFDEYRRKLAENFVVLSRIERRDRVLLELETQARRIGGRALVSGHAQAEALLEEVPDLVEFPSVVGGAFSAEFLSLPEEVLTTTLIRHQHFFPVVGMNGRLMPAFLAVTNTQPTNERAIATNAERVVTARLRDARFFWDADRQVGLEARLERLETLLFHEALGSYRRKARRIEALAGWIAAEVLWRPDLADAARRAGRLAKADLATEMVGEFAELQGTMGGIYAREAGEPEAVWKAIYHHYLPVAVERTAPPAADALGEAGAAWAAVALADKLDTLV